MTNKEFWEHVEFLAMKYEYQENKKARDFWNKIQEIKGE